MYLDIEIGVEGRRLFMGHPATACHLHTLPARRGRLPESELEAKWVVNSAAIANADDTRTIKNSARIKEPYCACLTLLMH